MDLAVPPGTDFYQFVNGGWLKSAKIPEDQVTWGPTVELVERNNAILHDLLESGSADRVGRSQVEREVGDFYTAAMDGKRAEELGFSPIQPDLNKIAALKSTDELPALLAAFHARGIGGFFDASVQPDARHSTVYALEFSQDGLGLPEQSYYFGPLFAKERAAYVKHIAKMFELLGDSAEVAATEATAVLEVETALAKVSRKLEDLTDPIANYHRMSLPEFQKSLPAFNLTAYLDTLHAEKPQEVIVGQPEFFKGMQLILEKQKLETLKSYLRWHLLLATVRYLHEAAVAESFAFYGTVLSGQPQNDPRWKRAVRQVDRALGEALGQLYVERYFPPEARKRMDAMVANIRGVYRERLANAPWMSEPTRKEAVAKFDRFGTKIGAPVKFRDYSAVEIRRDDFLGNVERASQFESARDVARIGKPVDRSEWEMTPPTVNAYFNPVLNEIVFPAGILQPPFFDLEMDDAVNYGATGATIGHEMTHGYDNEGRQYDAEGNLRDWWAKSDVKQFNDRSAKLVKQYDAIYPLPGLHINGKLTLAENIADLGGLSIAYEALERALAADPSLRKEIDGYTPEQRFFISFAQSWASKEREAYLRQSLTTDTHSPDKVRGYAPQQNLQQFYDAFGIKKGAPMWRDPQERAVIW